MRLQKTKKYLSLLLSTALLIHLFAVASMYANAADELYVTKTLDLSATTLEDWNIPAGMEDKVTIADNVVTLQYAADLFITPKNLPADARIQSVSFDCYVPTTSVYNRGVNYYFNYLDADTLGRITISRGGEQFGWKGAVELYEKVDGAELSTNRYALQGMEWEYDSEAFINTSITYDYTGQTPAYQIVVNHLDGRQIKGNAVKPIFRLDRPNAANEYVSYKNIIIVYEENKADELEGFLAQHPVLRQTAADVTAVNAMEMERAANIALQAAADLADQDVKEALADSVYQKNVEEILTRANLLLNGKAAIPAGQHEAFLSNSGAKLGYINGKLPSVSGKIRFTGGKGVWTVYNGTYANFDVTVTPAAETDGIVVDATKDNVMGHVNDVYKSAYQKYGPATWNIGNLNWKIGSTEGLEIGAVSEGVFTGNWLDFQISYLWISKDGTMYNGRNYVFEIFKDAALQERFADGAWATCLTISDGVTQQEIFTLNHGVAQLGQCYTFAEIDALSFGLTNMEMKDVVLDYTAGLSAPELQGATIKVAQNPSDQDLRFNVTIPAEAAERAAAAGYTPVEIGAVAMTTQKMPGAGDACEQTLTLGMAGKGGLPVLTASRAVSGNALPEGFSVRLRDTGIVADGDATSICGVRFTLRAYIAYADESGQRFYIYSNNSIGDTSVENGAASKSVIGVAKAIAAKEIEQGAAADATINAILSKNTATTNEEKAYLLEYICANAAYVQ